MAEKTVASKGHVKPGTTIGVIGAVPGVVESLGLPEGVSFVDPADAQLVFLFARDRAELDGTMPAAVAGLARGARLWVFFRKGSSTSGLDMSRNDVWTIAERGGLRPLGLVSVDDTWTAFRFKQGTD